MAGYDSRKTAIDFGPIVAIAVRHLPLYQIRMTILLIFAVLLSAPLPAQPREMVAAETENFDPARIDVVDAIGCRLDPPTYNGFAAAVMGEDGLAGKRRWQAVKTDNPFMVEYDLPTPIVVAGGYSTRRIAFMSAAVVAILDLADPAVIARTEHVDNAMDPEPLIAEIVASGKATRAQVEAEMTFRKFLGERVITDVTDPVDGERWRAHTVIARTISNVTTHPGKTLYGCSYKIELLDRDGKPL